MAAVHARMTLAEFLALPERKPALEYDDGVVTQKVSPKGRHSVLQLATTTQINEQTVPNRLARAFPELRATCATLSRVPDVAVYRWERIPRDEAGCSLRYRSRDQSRLLRCRRSPPQNLC